MTDQRWWQIHPLGSFLHITRRQDIDQYQERYPTDSFVGHKDLGRWPLARRAFLMALPHNNGVLGNVILGLPTGLDGEAAEFVSAQAFWSALIDP